jgi:hypothetical protein
VGRVVSINSLITYNADDGSAKLLFASNDSFYDGTINGASATPVLTGLSNDKWQTAQFANSGGHWLFAVNGSDNPILFDGTTYHRLVSGDGVVSYTIANINPATFINVTIHQARAWFVEKDSLRGWYLPTQQIYGVATSFDFGPIFPRGGYLVALATWSVDAGQGSDDKLVAISSEGEVAVYQGIDPATVDTWALVGVYYIGEPLGYRCYCKIAGDLAILTQTGLVPLSQALQSTEVNANSVAFTDIIQHLISDLVAERKSYFGWCLLLVPKENWLMLNVPNYDGTSYQLVMNTITQRWCAFTGWPTTCLTLYEGFPFFATLDKIYKAAYGTLDYVAVDGTGGQAIPFSGRQAYNFFNTPGNLKLGTLARPTFITGGGLNYSAVLARDYTPVAIPTLDVSTVDAPLWDDPLWDSVEWGAATTISTWVGEAALGYALSIQVKGTSTLGASWASTNIIYQVGGLLG